jgi:hypothetical protein
MELESGVLPVEHFDLRPDIFWLNKIMVENLNFYVAWNSLRKMKV